VPVPAQPGLAPEIARVHTVQNIQEPYRLLENIQDQLNISPIPFQRVLDRLQGIVAGLEAQAQADAANNNLTCPSCGTDLEVSIRPRPQRRGRHYKPYPQTKRPNHRRQDNEDNEDPRAGPSRRHGVQ
jgi:hypothetical protein